MTIGYQHISHAMGADDDYLAKRSMDTRLSIGGSLLVNPTEEAYVLALKGLFREPISELRRGGCL